MVYKQAYQSGRSASTGAITSQAATGIPGKRTLIENLPIQPKAIAGAFVDALPGASEAIEQARGDTGHVPDATVRGHVEHATGASLDDARVHTGSSSAVAAASVGARAYTTGSDIHFGAGEYNPGSPDGSRLLAHELAHTVQQRRAGGSLQRKALSGEGDAAEHNADQIADAALSGRSGVPVVQAPSNMISRYKQPQPTINPQPPVDATGAATTTHADPTVHDAVNAPAQPAAATEAHAANVKVVADRAAPVAVAPNTSPSAALIYQVSPAAVSPAPTGFVTITGLNGTMAAPQVEQVMTDALYIAGQPSPNDVQQGGIGDCYFMATLMSISQRDPGKIKSMMTPDGQGGATVTFWRRTMSDPNWIKRIFGSKPEPQYSQVTIHVSEQLQYWFKTPLGSGQRIANGHNGFFLRGAQLHADAQARDTKWWGELATNQLEIHRRDEYDTALWVPLMEKAFAAFAERYGQYGGSQGEAPATGSGYNAINGGWSQQAMFVFYGAHADMNGSNEGGLQQQATQWAPGSQVLATNPRAVDQLLLLQGKPDTPAPGEKSSPVVTATSMVYALIPRLQAAIPVAQSDPDWANVPAAEQTNVASITVAINTYNALPNDPAGVQNGPKAQARAAIGTASSTAITKANAPTLLDPARSSAVKSMVELVLDLKNIGTDNSPGQRNIYGDHVYSVTGVNFCTTTGIPVPLNTVGPAQRPAFFPLVDTTVSKVTLRNPHHSNTPDPTGSGTGPDGPTQGVSSSGTFHMNLEQFFRNYTSVESGVFSKS
jgi:hypothetical protein